MPDNNPVLNTAQTLVFHSSRHWHEWWTTQADNNPNWTPAIRRRCESLEEEMRTAESLSQRDRANDMVEKGIKPGVARVKKLVNDGRLETAKLIADLKAGRIKAQVGIRKLAQLNRNHDEANAIIAAEAASTDRLQEHIDQEPWEWSEQMAQRFPAMARGVRVTPAFLEGREPSPLRQGR
jgi:hypothetical protein